MEKKLYEMREPDPNEMKAVSGGTGLRLEDRVTKEYQIGMVRRSLERKKKTCTPEENLDDELYWNSVTVNTFLTREDIIWLCFVLYGRPITPTH